MEEKDLKDRPVIAFGLNNIGCDQNGATFQTIIQNSSEAEVKETPVIYEARATSTCDVVDNEELCHFIYPGLNEKESWVVHHQIKDLVKRFAMKDICAFLRSLEKEKKILLPQIPQNAFDELHRMGLPPEETKGYSYDNFCKFYRI